MTIKIKKPISLILLTILFSSCKYSGDTDKVSKLINEYMTKNVDDPSTYELVETNLIDSTVVDSADLVARKIIFPNGDESAQATARIEEPQWNIVKRPIVDSLKKINNSYSIRVVTYYFYEHKYRIKTKGEKQLKTMYFVFDGKKEHLLNADTNGNSGFKNTDYYLFLQQAQWRVTWEQKVLYLYKTFITV